MFPQIKWPSFENIHYGIAKQNLLSSDKPIYCYLSQKMNGSNVSVEVSPEGLIQIGSRNQIIYHFDRLDSENFIFQGKDASFLLDEVPKIVYLRKHLHIPENHRFVLFGEFMRSTQTWHPFGYVEKIPKHNPESGTEYYTKVRLMCPKLRTILIDLGMRPVVIYSGKFLLQDAVDFFDRFIMKEFKEIEGVFVNIIHENGECYVGFKLKTPQYEEQLKNLIVVDEVLKNVDLLFKDSYESMLVTLCKIFDMKKKVKVQKVLHETDPILTETVNKCLESFKSKNDISSFSKMELMKKLIPEVSEDVQNTYEKSSLEVPANKAIRKEISDQSKTLLDLCK